MSRKISIKPWASLLRMPGETAWRLKKAVGDLNKDLVGADRLSLNTTIVTLVEAWLEGEGYGPDDVALPTVEDEDEDE